MTQQCRIGRFWVLRVYLQVSLIWRSAVCGRTGKIFAAVGRSGAGIPFFDVRGIYLPLASTNYAQGDWRLVHRLPTWAAIYFEHELNRLACSSYMHVRSTSYIFTHRVCVCATFALVFCQSERRLCDVDRSGRMFSVVRLKNAAANSTQA